MKKISLLLSFALFTIAPLFSQADQAIGIWLTSEGTTQIRIFKATDGKYYGKIVWLDEPNEKDGNPKIDDKNPDVKLQSRPLMNLLILRGFSYDEGNEQWNNGTIYDPKNGKTYDCYMWFEDDINTLQIKGYVLGIKFLGRETTWKREDKIRE